MKFPLAVNIALIPEKQVYEQCIAISTQLVQEQSSPYQLGTDGLPHITLMQTCIDNQEQWEALSNAIEEWVIAQASIQLYTKGLEERKSSGVLWWALEKENVIQRWHEQILELSQIIGHQQASHDMFLNTEKLRGNREVDWVRQYVTHATIQHFLPHFTLGYGNVPQEVQLPETFQAAALGVFQMGPYCSCYKELESWDL